MNHKTKFFFSILLFSISLILFAGNKKGHEVNPKSCLAADDSVAGRDGSHDFDFFSGRKWKIQGRKRVGRFVKPEKWEEMVGVEISRRIGDKAMLEEVVFPEWRPKNKLVILRIYDPITRKWSIYDANNPDEISPPLVGSFDRGVGIFIGDDKIDNQPVKVRYTWTCDWVQPRFQQEFSNDNGRTWIVDWTMEFTEAK